MEMITINKNEKNEQVVSARDLHEFLGVKSKFSDWIRNRVEKYDFVENTDYTLVTKTLATNNPKNPTTEITDYAITMSMAKELSMVENNDQGKQARKYFIECERSAKQMQMLYAGLFSSNHMEVVNSHKTLVAMAVAPVQAKLEEKTIALSELEENVADIIKRNQDATMLISTASKILGFRNLGEKKLFELLRERKHFTRNNYPSQALLEANIFVVAKKKGYDGDTFSFTPRVTVKGLMWLNKNLKKLGYERMFTEEVMLQQIKFHLSNKEN